MISVTQKFIFEDWPSSSGMARALWLCFLAALMALKPAPSTSSALWDLCKRVKSTRCFWAQRVSRLIYN